MYDRTNSIPISEHVVKQRMNYLGKVLNFDREVPAFAHTSMYFKPMYADSELNRHKYTKSKSSNTICLVQRVIEDCKLLYKVTKDFSEGVDSIEMNDTTRHLLAKIDLTIPKKFDSTNKEFNTWIKIAKDKTKWTQLIRLRQQIDHDKFYRKIKT